MSRPARYNEDTVPEDAVRYLRAHRFIEKMKTVKRHLTTQQYNTLRGQALAGDINGAEKGLAIFDGVEVGYAEHEAN